MRIFHYKQNYSTTTTTTTTTITTTAATTTTTTTTAATTATTTTTTRYTLPPHSFCHLVNRVEGKGFGIPLSIIHFLNMWRFLLLFLRLWAGLPLTMGPRRTFVISSRIHRCTFPKDSIWKMNICPVSMKRYQYCMLYEMNGVLGHDSAL